MLGQVEPLRGRWNLNVVSWKKGLESGWMRGSGNQVSKITDTKKLLKRL